MSEQWEQTQLGNVCEIILGQSPSSDTYNQERFGLPFFQGKSEFGTKYAQARTWCSDPIKAAKKEDILVSVRAPVGESNLAPENCCIGRGLAALRANDQHLLQEFLWHQINFKKGFLQGISQGSTFDAVSGKDLSELEVEIPPLPEQKKIAEILSGIDKLIDAFQKNERKLRTSLEAVSNSWHELDLSSGAHTEVCPLGDLLRSIDSGWSPPCESSPPGANEWGVLKVSAVTSGVFREEESKKLPEDEIPRERCLVKRGDLLITRANGNPNLVGRGAIVGKQPVSKLMMPDLLLRLTPNEKCTAEFMLILLNSQSVRTQIEIHLRGSTGAKKINQGLLRSLSVKCPPREVQDKIVLLSSSFDNSLESILRKLDILTNLKQSLSIDLLSGRKRVSI